MLRRAFGIIGLAAVVIALSLTACGHLEEAVAPATVEPQVIVIPDPDPDPSVALSKELSVLRATSYEPRVTSKIAVEAEVDLTSGSAELAYEIVVEDVLVSEGHSAMVAAIQVTNTGSAAITVDIVDTLYCGDGSGAIDLDGPLAIDVFTQNGVSIAADASFVAEDPFGPYDVSACPTFEDAITKDVVNRIVAYEAGTDTVIGQTDLLPTERDVISSIVGAFLVDEETLLDGHTFIDPSLKLAGVEVPFTVSTDAGSYTITTVEIASPGTYQLRKTIIRDAGLVCEPGLMVVNTASLVDGDGITVGEPSEATITLLCTPVLGGEGCTPGFWKNWTGAPPGLQPNAWAATGYHWRDPFTSAGFVNAYRNRTFLQVLDLPGGGRNALGRHTVAALLNAAHPNVAYDLTVADVVVMFNDVIQNNGDVNALKDLFESYNEQGCPLTMAVY